MDTFKSKFTGMNFRNMDGIGWPDSVVVDNGGDVLEGTYESMTYVPERTCEIIKATFDWECSECHERIFESVNYCPNCGAKVVE